MPLVVQTLDKEVAKSGLIMSVALDQSPLCSYVLTMDLVFTTVFILRMLESSVQVLPSHLAVMYFPFE